MRTFFAGFASLVAATAVAHAEPGIEAALSNDGLNGVNVTQSLAYRF